MPDRWGAGDGSVFALPDAPPQPRADRPGDGPAGRVERHRVGSPVLGGDRDTWVYLPPGHGRADRAPLRVLVLCDGDMWFGRLGLGGTLDALVADGALPPLAVPAPDAVDRDTRWRELGAREPFVSFLADELLPWAAGRWPLTTDPARTVVAGQDLGAVTALHAAHRRPERFGNVLAQSPSLWWRPGLPPPRGPEPQVFGLPWLVSRCAAPGPGPVAVHLEVGLHDGPTVEHGRALYEVLRGAGHRVTYTEFNGGHDYTCWQVGLADGLTRLPGA